MYIYICVCVCVLLYVYIWQRSTGSQRSVSWSSVSKCSGNRKPFLCRAAESVICADLIGHVLWSIGWWGVYQLCHHSWRRFDWSDLCHCDLTARPGNFGLRRCGQWPAGVMKSSQHHRPLSLHHRHHDVSFRISHHHHFGEHLPAACRVPFLWICLSSPGPRDTSEHGRRSKSTEEGWT